MALMVPIQNTVAHAAERGLQGAADWRYELGACGSLFLLDALVVFDLAHIIVVG